MDGNLLIEDVFTWDDEPTADTWAARDRLDHAEEIGSITVALEGTSIPLVPVVLPWDLAPRSSAPPPPSSRGSYEGLPPSWARAPQDSRSPSEPPPAAEIACAAEPPEAPAWLGDPAAAPARAEQAGTANAKAGDEASRQAERAAVAEAHAAADEALSTYAELRAVVNELKRIACALNT